MFPRNQDSRFWSKVDKTGECWVWTAGRTSDGYGYFHLHIDGRRFRGIRAHRYAYLLATGDPLGPTLVVHHKCENPPCVRPDHLAQVTPLFNTRASTNTNAYKKKTSRFCANGHEYADENTYISKRGRQCRTCYRARKRRGYWRRKANSV